jgi:hypothetical protein
MHQVSQSSLEELAGAAHAWITDFAVGDWHILPAFRVAKEKCIAKTTGVVL